MSAAGFDVLSRRYIRQGFREQQCPLKGFLHAREIRFLCFEVIFAIFLISGEYYQMSDLGGKTAIAPHSKTQANLQLQNTSLQPTPEITAVWKKVHGEMRQEFGEAIFRSWLKP